MWRVTSHAQSKKNFSENATDRHNLSRLIFFPVLQLATSVTKVGVWLCLSGGSFFPVVSGITPVVPTASSCCRTGSTLGLTRALVQVACS